MAKVTRVSAAGIALIHRWEELRLEAYLDVADIPTIGWGTTRYPDGSKVALGDTCTKDHADAYFEHDLRRFELAVDALTVDMITQRQFDALTSFAYNTGEGAYRDSTLRRRVNANPDDSDIRREFMRWIYSGGKRRRGLWNRRHAEADHYFGVTTPTPPYPY